MEGTAAGNEPNTVEGCLSVRQTKANSELGREVKTMNEMAVHERINFAELFQVGKNSCRERK